MKNLKRKMVVGVLSLSLVLGAGSALAATNAGDQLKVWYNKQFGSATKEVDKDLLQYGKSKESELTSWYDGVKTGATDAVAAVATDQITNSKNAIKDVKDSYISDIDATTNDIVVNGMPADFLKYKNLRIGQINTLAAGAVKTARGELTTIIDQKGDAEVINVTNEVNEFKTAAVNDLTTAIGKAKETLEAEIGTNSTTTTTNLKKYIDDQIVLKEKEVELIADGLVGTNSKKITDEGASLEGTAIKALNDLVAGINQ